jgi:hypothetical protein
MTAGLHPFAVSDGEIGVLARETDGLHEAGSIGP